MLFDSGSFRLSAAVLCVGIGVFLMQAHTQGNAQQRLPSDFQLPEPIRPANVDMVRLTTKGYFDRAQTVVYCKSTGKKTDYGPGGNIFTFYSFQTLETIKGGQRSTFQIRLLGGTIGDTSIGMALDKEFETGSEYVLMLGRENKDGFPTVNPGAVYVVRTEPQSGRKVVVPGVDGIKLYEKATGRVMRSAPDWAFLDDFVFSLKKSL